MKYRLLKLFVFFFFSIMLCSYISCNDDDKNCGKDIYDPMEHNPAKEVEWIVNMIKNKGGQSGSVSLYKMDDKSYYLSSMYPGTNQELQDILDQDYKKSSVNADQAPYFILDSEGKFCAMSFIRPNYEAFLEKFHKEAVFVAKLWSKESCAKLDPNLAY